MELVGKLLCSIVIAAIIAGVLWVCGVAVLASLGWGLVVFVVVMILIDFLQKR